MQLEKDLMNSAAKPKRKKVFSMLDKSNQRVSPDKCLRKFRNSLKVRPSYLLGVEIETRVSDLQAVLPPLEFRVLVIDRHFAVG